MEKLELTNQQTYEINDIKLHGENLEMIFPSASISELEEVFTNKSLVSTVRIITESGEQTASYAGYTKFVSITKDGESQLVTVTMGKIDETQEKIAELEKQIKALSEIVAKLL